MDSATEIRKIGSTPTGLDAFRDYLKAFSSSKPEAIIPYWNEDIVVDMGHSIGRYEGRDAALAYFSAQFETVQEHLTLHALAASGDNLFAEIRSRLIAIRDAPDNPVAPLKKGEYTEATLVIRYGLRDGRISSITIGQVGDLSSGSPAS